MRTKQKILMVAQCCTMDVQQSERLVALVADVCLRANGGAKSPHADLMIAQKHDAQFKSSVIREAARAFDQVHTFRGRDKAHGWPQGPNSLFSETLAYFATRKWDYSGIWFTEPDSIPLAVDFLAQVHREWATTDRLVLGCYVGTFDENGPVGLESHINGNLILAPEFVRIYPEILSSPPKHPWDAKHRKALVRHGCASTAITSEYRLGVDATEIDCDYLFNRKAVWLHGTKTPLALACARERLLEARVVGSS